MQTKWCKYSTESWKSFLTHQVNVITKLHLLWHVWLPDGLTQQVVWLPELNGYHDPAMHGFIQVIGTVSGQDDQTIMSAWGEKPQDPSISQIQ